MGRTPGASLIGQRRPALRLARPASPGRGGRHGGVDRAAAAVGCLARMTLPRFARGRPGPELHRRAAPRRAGPVPRPVTAAAGPPPFEIRHGTTIAAIRYADGVVMAGDRRATAGSSIAHRTMEKVHPADRHSGVAIAGAAGPAMEMVKLFQLQLEHYEKVEGQAAQPGGQGQPAVPDGAVATWPWPCRALWSSPCSPATTCAGGVGRIYTYDPTGGRYEETDFHADGSGGRDARTTIKLGWRDGPGPRRRHRAGRPGPVAGGRRGLGHRRARRRPGHLPDGGHHHGRRLRAVPTRPRWPSGSPPSSPAEREGAAAMSMPFYVAPEQFMKDKADFARKNIARGRPLVATVYAGGILICAENPSKTLHKVSEIYDRIAFAGVGRYNEFDQLRRSGVQHADVKGYQFSREDVDARSLANLYAQYMGNVFTHEMKPLEVEILVAEVGTEPAGTSSSTSSTTASSSTRTASACSAARPTPSPPAWRSAFQADWDLARGPAGRRRRPRPARTGPGAPPTWRWRSWTGATAAGPSGGSTTSETARAARPSGAGRPAGRRRRARVRRSGRVGARPSRRRRAARRPSSDPRTAGRDGREPDAGQPRRPTDHDQHERHQRPAAGGTVRPSDDGPAPAAIPAPRRRGRVEGRFDLVGEEQLLGALGVVLGHPDRHRRRRVGAVDAAPELGEDAVGAAAGRR